MKRPRLGEELERRIEESRGDVPFDRFVRRLLESALDARGAHLPVAAARLAEVEARVQQAPAPGSEKASGSGEGRASSRASEAALDGDRRIAQGRGLVGSSSVTPTSPVSPRVPARPTAQQLAGRAKIPVATAVRLLAGDEWRKYV